MFKRVSVVIVLGFLLVPGIPSAQDSSTFKVVVHASNPVSSLTRSKVSLLFLKKTTRWDDNKKVLPVDQQESSSVRAPFSQTIHGKDVLSVKRYWNTQIFSGRATPPPGLSSDAEVLSYVRSNPGSIGYVSKGASIGDGVKVVNVNG